MNKNVSCLSWAISAVSLRAIFSKSNYFSHSYLASPLAALSFNWRGVIYKARFHLLQLIWFNSKIDCRSDFLSFILPKLYFVGNSSEKLSSVTRVSKLVFPVPESRELRKCEAISPEEIIDDTQHPGPQPSRLHLYIICIICVIDYRKTLRAPGGYLPCVRQ